MQNPEVNWPKKKRLAATFTLLVSLEAFAYQVRLSNTSHDHQ